MDRLTTYLYENEPSMDCLKCSRRKTGKCNSSADCAIFAAERLSAIEDILGDNYDLDRIRELVEADRYGRCVVLPVRGYTDKDGEQALNSTMNTCFYHNNPVTRYIADAVAEKLTREAAEAALKGERVGKEGPSDVLGNQATLDKYRLYMGKFLKGERDGV